MFLSSHRFSWMSQANYVFKRLDITSSHDEYMCCEGLVISLRKTLKIPEDPSACPYLFICPPADPSTRQLSWYWSFDLQGSTRLTVEDAASHGLPVLEMDVNWYGHSWDASAYEGLRSFHSAKGFDPESQDLAIHLGHPLYQIVGDMAPGG
ncbi:hypothetical protein FB45DRAFT_890387 [Roridomyces roridus]|uniref:Uncharacterized protein n=1 Tax=Roridomyces roridus TaxID=1738132 RepID=A0AAD7CKX1_9AGAR|nr:hypothetical protein FB45DRAFT_890387 [Roridomyces roridus]